MECPKILAIDDNADNIVVMKALMNEAFPDATFISALSGKRGIELSLSEKPDVILTDIVMPEMDGYEVCKTLKANDSTKIIPVIMVTAARADKESRIRALECGADAFLAKPVDESELAAQVRAMLRIKEAEDQKHDEKERLKKLVKERTIALRNELKERRKSEEALQKSQLALLEAQQVARVGSWEYDVRTDKSTWSNEMFRIFGRDQSLGEPSWLEHRSSIHPDDWNDVDAAVQSAIKDGTPYSVEFRTVHPDGTILWAWTVGKPEQDSYGQVFRIYGTVQEISDRKQAEEAIRKNEERFKQVAEGSGTWIWEVDANGLYTYVNDYEETILGYTPEEVVGKKHFYDFFAPEIKDDLKKQAFEVFSQKDSFRNFENPNIHKDGRRVILETMGFPVLGPDGKLLGYRGADKDITERKQTEEALRLSEEKFRSIFENHSAIKLLIDPETGNIADANQAAADYYGWSRKELKQMKISQINILSPEQILDKMEHRQTHFEFRHRLQDGSIRDVEVFSSKLEIGGKAYLHSINHDITERKQAESALKESEERYRRFISQVSEGVYRFETEEPMDISLPLEEQVDFIYDHMFIAECNDAFLKMYGLSNENEMIGKGHLDFHGGRNNEINRNALRSFVKNGYRIEDTLTEEIVASGQKIYFSNNSIGILEDNKLVRMWGTQYDITDRIKDEHVQHVLYSISNAALSSISLSELIEFISKEIGKLLDSTNFYIAFYDEKTNMLSTLYERDEKDVIQSWSAEKSITGYVIKHQKSMRITEPDVKKLCEAGEIELLGTPSKVWLGVPLNLNNKVIGALVVQSYDNPNAYTEKDKQMLEFVSHQISISIERKKSETEIREKEVQYHNLADSGTALIWTSGTDKLCNYFNEPWLNFTGRTLEQEMGYGWAEGVHPEDFDGCVQTYNAAFDKREPFEMEYRLLHASGEYRWLQDMGTPNYNSKGEFIGYIGHCFDISDRKKMEIELIIAKEKAEGSQHELKIANDELLERNSFIQTILDNLPIGIALNNIDKGVATYMNKRFEEIYGWNSDEITSISTFFEHVYPDADYRNKLIAQIMSDIQTGDPAKMHWENIFVTRKDGTKRVVNAVNIPLVEQNTMVSTVSDITELNKTQNDLLAAKEKAEESDHLKSAFLANMSHEIRTPLNSILGFSDLLLDPDYDAEQKNEFARMINAGGSNLLAIISDIIDISKIEAGQVSIEMTVFPLQKLVKDIQKEYSYKAQEKKLELRLDLSEMKEEIWIESDENRLRQILINFIGNAIKFTEKGFVEIGITPIGRFIEFRVRDTGIGIPKDYHDKIFERFRQVESADTRKYGGNGLGLSISKSLIELLGGSVRMESELGNGSCFYFLIPVSQK
jgi:PAS domain S-box-containing protein